MKNNQMSLEEVEQQMMKIDLSFTTDTIQSVHEFLNKHIGQLSQELPRYHIAAAAAIVSQCTKVATIGNSSEKVSSGMNIEKIMKRLNDLSRDVFLDTLNFQAQKFTTNEHYLKEKIAKIRLTYRSYKKFSKIFKELYKKAKLPANITSNLQSFFWIIYLLLKLKTSAKEDLEESTKIQIIILQLFFTKFFTYMKLEEVNEVIYSSDNFWSAEQVSAENSHYSQEITRQILKFYESRSSHPEICFQNLMENPYLLIHLINDLNKAYDQIFIQLPEGRYIDEIRFLELNQDITPHPTKKQFNEGLIEGVIKFQDDSNEDQPSTTEEKSKQFQQMPENIKPINLLKHLNEQNHEMKEEKEQNLESSKKKTPKTHFMTPFSLEIVKNSWAKQCMKKIGEKEENYMGSLLVRKGKTVEEIKDNIGICIKEIVPYLKKDQCLNQIYKLAVYLIVELEKESKNTEVNIEHNLMGIICLASCLYFYSTRSLKVEFSKYCSLFKIGLIEGFQAIYNLGSTNIVNDPIREYLFAIEKILLLQQIWETNLGYQLISEKKIIPNSILDIRLKRHIIERVKQICQKTEVQISLEQKITTLVNNLLKEKYELLEGNKLDQIIICSVTACLTINESRHSKAISQIFYHYNKTSNSFHSYQGGLNSRQGKMNLFQFYNNVFLLEVEDMMRNTNETSFICTPIREQQIRRARGNRVGSLSLSGNGFGAPMNMEGNYQKSIKANLRNSIGDKNRLTPTSKTETVMVPEEGEEGQSPRFGPKLIRTFTFSQK